MIFSSISFLFFFLPLLFLSYFICPIKYRHLILLLYSLIFYFLGEGWYLILLIISCIINYLIGSVIYKQKNKIIFILGLLFNIGLLFYFKYMNFFLSTISDIFNFNIPFIEIILPLGISFFTFQNLSYLIDVYREDVVPSSNILNYMTYITLFPQLVAGPIVRYKDIEDDLLYAKGNINLFGEGVTRFIIGLSKKVIIADTIYNLYTNLLQSNMTMLSYILIAICFTLQIYYDFSGYSDMAIGLGKMFGLNFKENFNYPLVATSITDFWRRWHISLSTFFKNYVYIPLGGNKCCKIKHIRNIFIVWFLTGIWHGASWNFILWGVYFFIFLILEKFILKKYLKGGLFSHIYTLIIVVISFVIFNITDLKEILVFLKGMIGIGVPIINREFIYYLKTNLVLLIIAFIGISPFLKEKLKKLQKGKTRKVFESFEAIGVLALFLITIASIVSSSFNPFIYFRF